MKTTIKTLLLYFLCVFLNSKVQGQSTITFNRTYNNGIDNTSNVLAVIDGYITAVTSGFPITPRKMVLTKVDLNGDLVWQKMYGDSNTFDSFFGLITTSDGNFMTGSYSKDISTSLNYIKLIKFNDQGDTIWTKNNYSPPGFNYFTMFLIETNDNGFLISGERNSLSTSNIDAMIVKTDSSGNFQWIKTYGGTSYDSFYSSIQLPDNGFLSLGSTDSYGAGDRDWYLVKTDSIGNFIWQKTFGTNEFDVPFGITKTTDLKYILSGAGWINNVTFYSRLIKIDSSGTILNQKNFLNFPSSEIWWTREINDSNFISVGSIRNTILNKDQGSIIKTDTAFNILWSRTFLINNDYSFFRDIKQANDGGFIAAGFVFTGTSGGQDAWLVKLDSLGCDSAGCATYVTGIDDVANKKQIDISILPNPAKTFITCNFAQPMFTACLIRILNLLGAEVFKQTTFIQKQFTMPVNTLPNGVYILEAFYEGKKEYAKFVKE